MQRCCIKVELLRREQCKHRSTEHKPHLSFFWLFTFLRRAHISDSRALLTFSGANVQRCSVQFLKSATSKNVKLPFSHICCLLSATKLQSFCHYFPFPPLYFSSLAVRGSSDWSASSEPTESPSPLSASSSFSSISLVTYSPLCLDRHHISTVMTQIINNSTTLTIPVTTEGNIITAPPTMHLKHHFHCNST